MHLVNYDHDIDTDTITTVSNLELGISVSTLPTATTYSVTWQRPEAPDGSVLPHQIANGRLIITVPETAPFESAASGIEFVESNCGLGNKSGTKILIAYASKCGSTGEVAEAIGNILCQHDAVVETKPIKSVTAIEGYQAVVIGGAIHQSRWMPEATYFVTRHQNVLSGMPVAYFFTCLTLSENTDKARRRAMTFLDPLKSEAPQVKPVSVGRFSGVLDYSKLSFMYRTVMKRKMKKRGVQEGDYRDWHAIRSWAAEIHAKLVS